MRKISEILKLESGKRPVFSFEFFPPKTEEGEVKLMQTIEKLGQLSPDFVSVTYGAGGSTRDRTKRWVNEIQKKFSITAMAHFTCVGHGKAEIEAALKELFRDGILNIMALRGDPPKGDDSFQVPADGFAHADDLIAYIDSMDENFSIGGAGYPEVHVQAESAEKDLYYLKQKVDRGADFIVTQLFFDNQTYFEFVNKARNIGVTCPIIPGLMPITQFSQIERFTNMAGCSIPDELRKDIAACGDDRGRLLEVSLGFSINQCRELLKGGAPGIHFYTLNQSQATTTILKAIR